MTQKRPLAVSPTPVLETPRALQGAIVPPFDARGWTHETARVHHAHRRRGGRMAARRSRAEAGADAECRRVHGSFSADDQEGLARVGALLQGLRQLGWAIGRNLRIEYRWGAERNRRYAAELAALSPDVILTSGSATIGPLLQATRTVPVVFVNVSDPVGAGFVDSLAQPGGNATGFIQFEFGLSGKWLELLKQIAPGVMRAAVIRDPAISAGLGQWGALQTAAPPLGVEITRQCARPRRNRARDCGLRALPEWRPDRDRARCGSVRRDLIVTLAARHKLPAVYYHAISLSAAASSPMRLTLSNSTGKRPATSIASSRATSRPTCRCRRRPSTSW